MVINSKVLSRLIGPAIMAATGVYKGVKAFNNNKEAKEIEKYIKDIVPAAEHNLEQNRLIVQQALSGLGEKKADSLRHHIEPFIQEFQKIKNIDLSSPVHSALTVNEFSHVVIEELQKQINFITSAGLGVAGGATGGVLTAYGAYSGVMLLGKASTGTAIGTLHGAAATNATLAWLGGGPIAAGGGGIAAGTLVLGTLTLGTGLVIAGFYIDNKAKQNLENARSNLAKARKYCEDINTGISILKGIDNVAKSMIDLLSTLNAQSQCQLAELQKVFETQGCDYAMYDDNAKEVVMKNIKVVQAMKTLIDTPIIDEQGNLLKDASSNIAQVSQYVKNGLLGEIPSA
ncbi:hypothetical protein ACFFHK_01705 [Gallibacterium trehalosifermentans]|uniref:Chemotaxis protein n=1 Tax=Gallibacterium trehalosifermentans TaxID=516935 RepID=A0ABV6GYH9_9PAST